MKVEGTRFHTSSAVFPSLKFVGDGRHYEWVTALRAVETIDFMTARWTHLPPVTVEWE
ncbi:MAG: hypothetical protein JJU25_14350 [Halomonas sp.]|nr:hypothetical protein [Halomonas sp.]MCC5883799.1 hypothetical protein [Halomonas sp.]